MLRGRCGDCMLRYSGKNQLFPGIYATICSVLFPPCSMQIEHFEKGLTYTDKELLAVARRIGKLATYCSRLKDESSVIRVEAEKRDTKKESDMVKVMITIELPKKQFRAESRKAGVVEAFDRAAEKIEPQLIRYKEMTSQKGRVRKARTERNRSLAV